MADNRPRDEKPKHLPTPVTEILVLRQPAGHEAERVSAGLTLTIDGLSGIDESHGSPGVPQFSKRLAMA